MVESFLEECTEQICKILGDSWRISAWPPCIGWLRP